MFTQKFNRKENTEQGVRYYFDFSNGAKTYTDACVPQDLNGLKFWIKSRLEKYNTEEKLESELVPGQSIDMTDIVVVPPLLTQAEIARNAWLEKYSKWVRIKTTMIDTGVLTGKETQVKNFLSDVKAGFKPAYINYL